MEKNTFDQYYEQNIAPSLPEMEKKRQKLSSKGKKRMKVFNGVIALFTAIGSIYAGFYFESFIVFFSVAFGVLIIVVLFQDNLKAFFLRNDGFKNLKKEYKSKVVSQIIRFFGKDWTYEPGGIIAKQELLGSHLFDLRRTKIETDDVIKGSIEGRPFLIGNVKTTSVSEHDIARQRNTSGQSFNGLFVRLKYESKGAAFLVPKAKTVEGLGGLAAMKFTRDPNMTKEEQKRYNLVAMGRGIGGYGWKPEMTGYKDHLTKHEFSHNGQKDYRIYTTNENLQKELAGNQKLNILLSESFANKQAEEQLTKFKSFQLLDNQLMDQLVQTTLTYAIHSGYVWVLIPAFEEKLLPLTHHTQETII